MKHSKKEIEVEVESKVEIEKDDKKGKMPSMKIEVEPKIEIEVAAPDMQVVADAIKGILIPKQEINVTVKEPEDKKQKTIKIEVTERDDSGYIKTLILTEM